MTADNIVGLLLILLELDTPDERVVTPFDTRLVLLINRYGVPVTALFNWVNAGKLVSKFPYGLDEVTAAAEANSLDKISGLLPT